jgi:asparagine synthase (glutamine-hydrolysing)
MCGIAGFFSLDGRARRPDGDALLMRQARKLYHRGPDAQQVFNGPGVGLAHARLAIIDLSTGANQPMSDDDGKIQVVFNGEIYNFQDLRRELEGLGFRFKTHSDTEVIVKGYQAWGIDMVKRLRGMFAIALWDETNDRLVLYRDRVGKKPLCYGIFDGTLVFASEIKGILVWPGVPREPDLDAINDYLTYQYVPSPATAFQGIFKLPPAHFLVVERGKAPRSECYYQLPSPRQAGPARPLPELHEELIHHLREATRLRLIADVPLGAFLSGGVDSSAVVAMMALESSRPVKTFTIGFEEQGYDERAFAQAVAKRYATDHHEYVVRPDAMAILPTIVYHYGEPYADSSAIPTYYVSQIAREQVTVALNGDGGDESFLGYPRYTNLREWMNAGHLPIPVRSTIDRLVRKVPSSWRRGLPGRAIEYAASQLGDLPSRKYERAITYFSDAAKESIYAASMRGHLARSSLDVLDNYFAQSSTIPAGAAWADIHTYLPDDLLVKVDIASMARSLECRSPFLDHVLMEWAASLPESVKLQGNETKALLKQALEPYLPRDLLYRPKMGFGVPVDIWLRNEMRDFAYDTLLTGPATQRGLFDPRAVRQLLDGHCHGKSPNAARIWALLMLELWFQMWIDDPYVAQAPEHPSVSSSDQLACQPH